MPIGKLKKTNQIKTADDSSSSSTSSEELWSSDNSNNNASDGVVSGDEKMQRLSEAGSTSMLDVKSVSTGSTMLSESTECNLPFEDISEKLHKLVRSRLDCWSSLGATPTNSPLSGFGARMFTVSECPQSNSAAIHDILTSKPIKLSTSQIRTCDLHDNTADAVSTPDGFVVTCDGQWSSQIEQCNVSVQDMVSDNATATNKLPCNTCENVFDDSEKIALLKHHLPIAPVCSNDAKTAYDESLCNEINVLRDDVAGISQVIGVVKPLKGAEINSLSVAIKDSVDQVSLWTENVAANKEYWGKVDEQLHEHVPNSVLSLKNVNNLKNQLTLNDDYITGKKSNEQIGEHNYENTILFVELEMWGLEKCSTGKKESELELFQDENFAELSNENEVSEVNKNNLNCDLLNNTSTAPNNDASVNDVVLGKDSYHDVVVLWSMERYTVDFLRPSGWQVALEQEYQLTMKDENSILAKDDNSIITKDENIIIAKDENNIVTKANNNISDDITTIPASSNDEDNMFGIVLNKNYLRERPTKTFNDNDNECIPPVLATDDNDNKDKYDNNDNVFSAITYDYVHNEHALNNIATNDDNDDYSLTTDSNANDGNKNVLVSVPNSSNKNAFNNNDDTNYYHNDDIHSIFMNDNNINDITTITTSNDSIRVGSNNIINNNDNVTAMTDEKDNNDIDINDHGADLDSLLLVNGRDQDNTLLANEGNQDNTLLVNERKQNNILPSIDGKQGNILPANEGKQGNILPANEGKQGNILLAIEGKQGNTKSTPPLPSIISSNPNDNQTGNNQLSPHSDGSYPLLLTNIYTEQTSGGKISTLGTLDHSSNGEQQHDIATAGEDIAFKTCNIIDLPPTNGETSLAMDGKTCVAESDESSGSMPANEGSAVANGTNASGDGSAAHLVKNDERSTDEPVALIASDSIDELSPSTAIIAYQSLPPPQAEDTEDTFVESSVDRPADNKSLRPGQQRSVIAAADNSRIPEQIIGGGSEYCELYATERADACEAAALFGHVAPTGVQLANCQPTDSYNLGRSVELSIGVCQSNPDDELAGVASTAVLVAGKSQPTEDISGSKPPALQISDDNSGEQSDSLNSDIGRLRDEESAFNNEPNLTGKPIGHASSLLSSSQSVVVNLTDDSGGIEGKQEGPFSEETFTSGNSKFFATEWIDQLEVYFVHSDNKEQERGFSAVLEALQNVEAPRTENIKAETGEGQDIRDLLNGQPLKKDNCSACESSPSGEVPPQTCSSNHFVDCEKWEKAAAVAANEKNVNELEFPQPATIALVDAAPITAMDTLSQGVFFASVLMPAMNGEAQSQVGRCRPMATSIL